MQLMTISNTQAVPLILNNEDIICDRIEFCV